MIDRIREAGILQGVEQVEERSRRLRETCGFRVAETAEYALIASCFSPYLSPGDMTAFRKLLDHFDVDYTLLPKEYCCGAMFCMHALGEKHQGDAERADELAREFLDRNLEQARAVGASKIVAYCAGCETIFRRLNDSFPEEMLWHPTLLAQLFQGGELHLRADFYSGCHRFRRAFIGSMPDVDSIVAALNKIQGLELHHLDSELCCTDSDQLESLVSSVEHDAIIVPCASCALSLAKAMAGKRKCRLLRVSEVLWASIDGRGL
jgi:heterodisulfide reductase subunit B